MMDDAQILRMMWLENAMGGAGSSMRNYSRYQGSGGGAPGMNMPLMSMMQSQGGGGGGNGLLSGLGGLFGSGGTAVAPAASSPAGGALAAGSFGPGSAAGGGAAGGGGLGGGLAAAGPYAALAALVGGSKIMESNNPDNMWGRASLSLAGPSIAQMVEDPKLAGLAAVGLPFLGGWLRSDDAASTKPEWLPGGK